jgi:hypothetical protein
MQDIPTKTDGVSTLPAAEFNQIPSELENLITDSGQTLSGADLFQSSKAVSAYAAGGDFYTDSGIADAYVLSAVDSKQAPAAYFTGMKVRFETTNATTGAATVNVAGLGVKNIKQFDGTTDPIAGSIPANIEVTLSYDGTNFTIISVASAAANTGAGSGTVTSVATGEGITGGPITTTGTASLDVNGLTENAAIDSANDFLVFYDTSLAGHRKIKPDDVPVSPATFTSAEQTITQAGSLTIAHGLGAVPKFLTAELICKTAELNYSINDIAPIATSGDIDSGSNLVFGMSTVIDATNIRIQYANRADTFRIMNKTTGNSGNITPANWKIVVRARL